MFPVSNWTFQRLQLLRDRGPGTSLANMDPPAEDLSS